MGYGILVAMETKKMFDFKSGRRLNKMSHLCYFVSKKILVVEKEYSELLFLTKISSFLRNRHFPVAMVTE